jgi:hypothetical protein
MRTMPCWQIFIQIRAASTMRHRTSHHVNYVDSPAQEPYPFVEERVLPPVVRTFIHFNMREVSEVSSDRVCRSAPAGDAEAASPRKHRRIQ